MTEIPAHPKKMVIISARGGGKTSLWEEWAKHNGYEVEHAELSELTIEGHEGKVIVMDSIGLYDAPLKPGQTLLDEFAQDVVACGRLIHERMAALPPQLHIYDEVRDNYGEHLVKEVLKDIATTRRDFVDVYPIRNRPYVGDGVVLKPSMPRKKGPPKRHGHRKGNKADRWR